VNGNLGNKKRGRVKRKKKKERAHQELAPHVRGKMAQARRKPYLS